VAQEELLSDLASKLWFTYRTGFEPLGAHRPRKQQLPQRRVQTAVRVQGWTG